MRRIKKTTLPSDYPDASTLAKLTDIKTVLDAIQTACQLIDNMISESEAQIDVVTQPSTLFLHDRCTYKVARFDGSASANIVNAVSGKKITVHYIRVQTQGTVIASLKDGSGGSELWEFKGQDREGDESPFVPYPACIKQGSTNTELYVSLSAAITVTIDIIYSEQT